MKLQACETPITSPSLRVMITLFKFIFYFCSSGQIPISDFTLVIKSGVPTFDESAFNFPLVSGKTMQHEIFKLVLRRSEKQVYFPRQGCKNTGDISICKIGDEKLIIPGKYLYRMSCEESTIFFPILAYTFWVVSSVF